jgi:hypothetical protein
MARKERNKKMSQSFLTQILTDMLAEAKAKGRANRRLKSGLHVEMILTPASVKIILWRDSARPSTSEWNTILKHFPYTVPPTEPEPETAGIRLAIHGTVPTQKATQLDFG